MISAFALSAGMLIAGGVATSTAYAANYNYSEDPDGEINTRLVSSTGATKTGVVNGITLHPTLNVLNSLPTDIYITNFDKIDPKTVQYSYDKSKFVMKYVDVEKEGGGWGRNGRQLTEFLLNTNVPFSSSDTAVTLKLPNVGYASNGRQVDLEVSFSDYQYNTDSPRGHGNIAWDGDFGTDGGVLLGTLPEDIWNNPANDCICSTVWFGYIEQADGSKSFRIGMQAPRTGVKFRINYKFTYAGTSTSVSNARIGVALTDLDIGDRSSASDWKWDDPYTWDYRWPYCSDENPHTYKRDVDPEQTPGGEYSESAILSSSRWSDVYYLKPTTDGNNIPIACHLAYDTTGDAVRFLNRNRSITCETDDTVPDDKKLFPIECSIAAYGNLDSNGKTYVDWAGSAAGTQLVVLGLTQSPEKADPVLPDDPAPSKSVETETVIEGNHVVSIGEKYKYSFDASLPWTTDVYRMTSLTLTDVLNDSIVPPAAENIKVTRTAYAGSEEKATDDTSNWNIKVDGQTIIASPKSITSNTFGVYTFTFDAELKSGDLSLNDGVITHESLDWYPGAETIYQIPNQITLTCRTPQHAAGDPDTVIKSNIVDVYTAKPKLELVKTADKESIKAGDTVHYTLTATETVDHARANNLHFTDVLPFNGPELDTNAIASSIKISVDDKPVDMGTCKVSVTKSPNAPEYLFDIQTPICIDSTQTAVVEYDVQFGKAGDKVQPQDIHNVATVSADNADPATDDAIVKLPILSLVKTADKPNINCGDTVHYTLTANVLPEDILVNNLHFTDLLPFEGPELDTNAIASSVKISVNGTPWDMSTCKVSVTKSAPGLYAYDIQTPICIDSTQTVVVEYDVRFGTGTEAVKAQDIHNVATVSADNADPATDDAIVKIAAFDGGVAAQLKDPKGELLKAGGDALPLGAVALVLTGLGIALAMKMRRNMR